MKFNDDLSTILVRKYVNILYFHSRVGKPFIIDLISSLSKVIKTSKMNNQTYKRENHANTIRTRLFFPQKSIQSLEPPSYF